MTQSQPPAVAEWMLRHLVLGDRTEALEGDLLEEFHGRSPAWYWRQVFRAILGFSNVLRIGWAAFLTVAFAVGWDYGMCLVVAHSAPSPGHFVSGNWIPHEEPIWIAVGIFFYVAVPLFIYLALTRNLSLQTCGLGIGAGVLVIIVLPSFQFQLATRSTIFSTTCAPGTETQSCGCSCIGRRKGRLL
jgi:hypothetical protein